VKVIHHSKLIWRVQSNGQHGQGASSLCSESHAVTTRPSLQTQKSQRKSSIYGYADQWHHLFFQVQDTQLASWSTE